MFNWKRINFKLSASIVHLIKFQYKIIHFATFSTFNCLTIRGESGSTDYISTSIYKNQLVSLDSINYYDVSPSTNVSKTDIKKNYIGQKDKAIYENIRKDIQKKGRVVPGTQKTYSVYQTDDF